jgi:dCMP deaminase
MPRPQVHTYFMQIAALVASRSTCLHRQVGAVLTLDGRIISTGYNGAASGRPHCLEIGCARDNVPSGTRMELCRAAHAEQNAINQAARYGIAVADATIYCTHMPCSACAKSIVNAGILSVFYAIAYPDPMAREIMGNIELIHWQERD